MILLNYPSPPVRKVSVKFRFSKILRVLSGDVFAISAASII